MLFLVHINSYEVICSRSWKVSKSYQNNKVLSIKKQLGEFLTAFHFIMKKHRAIFKIPAFYSYSYSKNAV